MILTTPRHLLISSSSTSRLQHHCFDCLNHLTNQPDSPLVTLYPVDLPHLDFLNKLSFLSKCPSITCRRWNHNPPSIETIQKHKMILSLINSARISPQRLIIPLFVYLLLKLISLALLPHIKHRSTVSTDQSSRNQTRHRKSSGTSS